MSSFFGPSLHCSRSTFPKLSLVGEKCISIKPHRLQSPFLEEILWGSWQKVVSLTDSLRHERHLRVDLLFPLKVALMMEVPSGHLTSSCNHCSCRKCDRNSWGHLVALLRENGIWLCSYPLLSLGTVLRKLWQLVPVSPLLRRSTRRRT